MIICYFMSNLKTTFVLIYLYIVFSTKFNFIALKTPANLHTQIQCCDSDLIWLGNYFKLIIHTIDMIFFKIIRSFLKSILNKFSTWRTRSLKLLPMIFELKKLCLENFNMDILIENKTIFHYYSMSMRVKWKWKRLWFRTRDWTLSNLSLGM